MPRALRSAIIKVKVQQGLVLISSYCTADTERPGVRIIRPVFFSFNYSAAENVLFDLRTRDAANRGTCPARRYINGSSAAARKKLIRQCDRKCSPPKECRSIADLGVDFLAAGIGNIHGKYPANWEGLDFDALDAIQAETGKLPLVLHGGSGIPDEMIKKAITLGVSKVNVNTECQLYFQEATRKYIEAGKDLEGKGYDPRKLLAPGAEAIKQCVKDRMEVFGCIGKA